MAKPQWAEVVAAIRAGIPKDGTFYRYLDDERKLENFGENEYERGVIEGCRRFATRLQDIVEAESEE
jgi:hypothetical protein